MKKYWGFPGGPGVKTSGFHWKRVKVRSLAGELRSCMSLCTAKKLGKRRKKNTKDCWFKSPGWTRHLHSLTVSPSSSLWLVLSLTFSSSGFVFLTLIWFLKYSTEILLLFTEFWNAPYIMCLYQVPHSPRQKQLLAHPSSFFRGRRNTVIRKRGVRQGPLQPDPSPQRAARAPKSAADLRNSEDWTGRVIASLIPSTV